MVQRIPHGDDEVEIRQAFQRLTSQSDVLTTGASNEVLVGQGVGVTPLWKTLDISDSTNLTVTSPVTLTGDDIGLDESAVDHGSIGGLSDDDHTQYLLADGSRNLTGNMSVDALITIDGRDLSVDGIKLDGIEALADVTDATNVAAAGAAMSGGAYHDGFSDFVANEHIDHTSVTLTAGSGLTGGGDISSNRTFDLDINGLTGESGIVSADTLAFYDNNVGANRKVTLTELSTALGVADEKVKVDAAATADYLGAASGDGALRTGTGLGYTDGGNYVTLAMSHLGIESLVDPGADRIMFWDDGESACKWLEVGAGLTLSGTSLTGGFTTRVRAYPSSAQDIVTSTWTKVLLQTEDYDGGGDFASSTFTAPANGYYLVCGAVRTNEALSALTQFIISIYVDGASYSRNYTLNYAPANSLHAGAVISDILYLTSSQTVELYVWHDHGANREIYGGSIYTWMSIHRLS